MLSVIIRDSGEPNVIKLTYENLYRELKDISDAKLIVSEHWFDSLGSIKTPYVCLVEPDCLVSSGYFSSQLGLFKKNTYFRKLAMLSSSTGVNNWSNKFYGYNVGDNHADGIVPNRDKKSNKPYAVQVGYVPGAIIRTKMLIKALGSLEASNGLTENLVFFSTQVSLAFWQQGDGNPVYINPNATYVSTEDYINDIGKFAHDGAKVIDVFKRQSI